MIIIDNSYRRDVATQLRKWANSALNLDVATGYFDVTAFDKISPDWQRFPQVRIVMGDQVSRTTRQAFLAATLPYVDRSIEEAKRQDDFLVGLPLVVEAMQRGQVQVRVYRKEKFHAKAYIAHDDATAQAMVGSSNFTVPGLTENLELNVLFENDIEPLRQWYDSIWEGAENITPDILKVMERHLHAYTPFEVYVRAMMAYFDNRLEPVSEWEQNTSRMYHVLSEYQRDGYHALMQIAARFQGALLCDGVGLGKTFIGLMLIERLLYERKRVALFVPKAVRAGVWEAKLREFLPDLLTNGRYSNFAVYNHSDLTRGGDYQQLMDEVGREVDAIIVDEAHHFRNRAPSRSRRLFDLTETKQVFLLTATPINNALTDIQHLIEYFARRKSTIFKGSLGISSLDTHIRHIERELAAQTQADGAVDANVVAYERELASDRLFQAVIVQRSRAFVRRSLANEPGSRDVTFPERSEPRVVPYSLQDTYGELIDDLKHAFDSEKPLLLLPLYVPVDYLRDNVENRPDAFEFGRQRQVVGLIRTILLKRFESSVVSFRETCIDLLLRLQHFFKEKASLRVYENWERRAQDVLEAIHGRRKEAEGGEADDDDDFNHDERLTKAFRIKVEALTPKDYDLEAMVADAQNDLELLVGFLRRLSIRDARYDHKLQALLRALTSERALREGKVLIFTQYRSTAQYLEHRLRDAGLNDVMRADSTTSRDIMRRVRAFAPYYNGTSSAELSAAGSKEIRVLVATDILAEGLNLQDATCIINYDLHWNPVRLMQRIGRVDRRLDPDAEAHILADHPDQATTRGKVYVYNFLPPDELDVLLKLYERVAHKTLRISRVFGIEGRKLLTPADDYNALREFNEQYEGTTTSDEELYLVYQRLRAIYPQWMAHAQQLPRRVFSGKTYPDARAWCLLLLPAARAGARRQRTCCLARGHTTCALVLLRLCVRGRAGRRDCHPRTHRLYSGYTPPNAP